MDIMQKFTFFLLFNIIFFCFPLSAQKVNNEDAQLRASTIEASTDMLYLSLTSNSNNSSSYIYVSFADSYSEKYVGVEDAIRMSLVNSSSPVFWSILDGTTQALFQNGLPMIDYRIVNLGFSAPQADTYTIMMRVSKRADMRNVFLVDNVLNDTINLLVTPTYQFTTTGTVSPNNSRFLLLIEGTMPMLVGDEMNIGGTLQSKGGVYVHADKKGSTGKINIDNTDANTMLMTNTVVLYSNDSIDGLLRNQNSYSNGGVKGYNANNPKKVVLRKYIASNTWTYFSLPFKASADIYQDNVKIDSTTYSVYEFDAWNRSDKSSPSSDVVWKKVSYTGGFAKANGYQINFTKGGYVDFVSNDSVEINTLFNNNIDKTITYPSYGAPEGKWKHTIGDGWALIGGLYSTTYKIDSSTIKGYKGTVYYRRAKSSQAIGATTTFGEIYLAAGDSITLGPYTPFYIQGESSRGDTLMNSFTYKKEAFAALSLESAEFRSANNENQMKDQLHFVLSSDKNNSYDRFYLTFADNYSESFRSVEDAIKMTTAYGDKPAAWSVLDETKGELFVNGFPMKDNREVQMGFSVPEAGNYTISVDALLRQDVKNVILLDKVTGKKTDLMHESYSFNTGAIKNENGRFVLYINSSYTDIPTINSSNPYAYVKDNILTIKNLSENDGIQILDLSGRTVASGKVSGKEFSTTLNQKGVYVVNIKGGKTIVLKVLNK